MFDITGELDLFLKAYVTIQLYITSFTLSFTFPTITLFKFSVDFTRPSFLGNLNGGALTLAIGPSSKNRLQGDLSDTSETIHVKGSGGGDVFVWSDQFGRGENNAQEFTGVTSIVANGGEGDDTIDLSGLNDGSVAVDHPRRRRQRHDHRAEGLGVFEELRRTRRGEGVRPALRRRRKRHARHQTFEHAPNRDLLAGGDGNDTLIDGMKQRIPGRPSATTIRPAGRASRRCTPTRATTDTDSRGAITATRRHGQRRRRGRRLRRAKRASKLRISSSNTDGSGILDLGGKSGELTFYLEARNAILVGWGKQSDGRVRHRHFSDVNDYAHMIVVDNIDSIGTILGGNGADTFNISRRATPARSRRC